MINADTYKFEHESFVSNTKGTSVGCIMAYLAHIPAFIMLLKLSQAFRKSWLIRDYVLLTLPTLFTMTVLSEYNYTSLACIIVVSAILSAISTFDTSSEDKDTNMINEESSRAFQNTSYLTLFKGCNVLITCIAILAVDFRIFPRRFAKTETFGVSLMDIGVGTFIVSSALTSRFARGHDPNSNSSKFAGRSTQSRRGTAAATHATSTSTPAAGLNDGMLPSTSGVQTTTASAAFILPPLSPPPLSPPPLSPPPRKMISTQYVLVLLLGVGRWAILKLLNYQEHVSEYGVHWNFFVTLFCVWTVADTMHHTIPRQFLVWIALVWLIAYQTLLVSTSLTDYLLSNVRTNIISANKEGIFSLLGYVPMYLLSESFSFNICFNRGHFHNSNTTSSSSSSSSNGDGGASVTSSMNTAAATASAQLEGGGSVNNINCDEFDINTVLIPGADDVTVTMDNNQAGTAEFDINNHATVLKEGRSHLGGNDSSLNIEVAKLSATAPGTGQPMRVIRWNRVLIWKLAISASVLWVAWLAGASVQPTSRRLVNLTYVALVLALTMSLLLMLYIIDNVSYGPAVCVLTLQYMSKHSLVVFLSANVLTGAVNMTLKTIYASRGTAIAVLSVYTLALTGIAYLAEYFSSHYKALKLR